MTTIATERPDLFLRLFVQEDAETLFALIHKNRDHFGYVDGDILTTVNRTIEMVRARIESPQEATRLRFGIWENSQLVGNIQLTPLLSGFAEIGYWVDKDSINKGYATTALNALSHYAFETLRHPKLIAFVDQENLSSQAVLRKCGFNPRLQVIGAISYTKDAPQ